MKIVSISGLDGSGKSTQIKLLQDYLESQGKKVFYFHAVQFSIANKKTTDNSQAKSITNASWLKIQLRKLALIIDLVRFKKLLTKLANENFDYLLSDRYFYDNVINIAYLSKDDTIIFSPTITKPYHAFYLLTNPDTIIKRDRVPDQGIEYLKKKKEILDKAVAKWNLTIIDGNKTKEDIFNNIKSQINVK